MASPSITLNDGQATPVSHTFLLQAQDLKLAKYIEEDASLAKPLGIEINHDIKPGGSAGTDRHMVKVFQTVEDSNGLTATPAISMQLSIPRNTGVSAAVIDNLVAYLTNYVATSGYVAKLVDGVTP